MSLERFEDLLNRFGPEIEEWPEMDRENARKLLETSEAAQKLMLFEQGLDKFLSSEDAPKAPRSLIDQIMSKAKKTD